MEKIIIFDTTLRDGTQGDGVNFSLADKLEITRELDRFGIDFLEGGWPGSNPKDKEYFERVRTSIPCILDWNWLWRSSSSNNEFMQARR